MSFHLIRPGDKVVISCRLGFNQTVKRAGRAIRPVTGGWLLKMNKNITGERIANLENFRKVIKIK